MIKSPYARFKKHTLTLNDYLAIDRTVLSNERTLLSYGRTALALAALGVTAIKFFDEWWLHALGGAGILLGVVIMGRGWKRYRHMQELLSAALEQMTGAPDHPLEEPKEVKEVKEPKETAAKKEE